MTTVAELQNDFAGLQVAVDAIANRVASLEVGKIPFHPSMLKPIGGFRVNGVRLDTNMRFGSGSIDKLPGSNKWVFDHGNGDYLIEFTEPATMGLPSVSFNGWPAMIPGRAQRAIYDLNTFLKPSGARWLDADNVVVSGRPSYRAQPQPVFTSVVNLNTGVERRITTPTSLPGIGDVPLGFGGGFTRRPDDPNGVYLACGGYDSLGSPFGPSLARLDISTGNITPGLYFPASDKELRDSAYWYPPSQGARPEMWLDPVGFQGTWQAGSASFGAAWIDHPHVDGIVYMAKHSRGWLDYRAQGDSGTGGGFTVGDCSVFYTDQGIGNRLGHSKEYWLADGPGGVRVPVIYSYQSEVICHAIDSGGSQQTHGEWWDFNSDFGINKFSTDGPYGVTWDNDRKLLWVSYVAPTSNASIALVAYEIDHTAARVDPPIKIPNGLKIDKTGKMVLATPIGASRNGLAASVSNGVVSLNWTPSTLSNHVNWQVWRSDYEDRGFSVVGTTNGVSFSHSSNGGYYLVTDCVGVDTVHAIRGKVRI